MHGHVKGAAPAHSLTHRVAPQQELLRRPQASGLLTHSRYTAQQGLEFAHSTVRSPLTCLGLLWGLAASHLLLGVKPAVLSSAVRAAPPPGALLGQLGVRLDLQPPALRHAWPN